jgi:hypothetical protein
MAHDRPTTRPLQVLFTDGRHRWAAGRRRAQTGVPAAVWFLPSSWGILAARGGWWALAALAALVVLLLATWAVLLTRRTTRVSGRGRRPITALWIVAGPGPRRQQGPYSSAAGSNLVGRWGHVER